MLFRPRWYAEEKIEIRKVSVVIGEGSIVTKGHTPPSALKLTYM